MHYGNTSRLVTSLKESRVQLGESQVELGTQILLGDEHSHLISCDESCCDVKLTGFNMNIRLAQLKLFNVWSYDGSNPGEKPPASSTKLD